jgi:hypothetical protein
MPDAWSAGLGLVPFTANGGFLSGDRLADEFSGISQTRPSTGVKP